MRRLPKLIFITSVLMIPLGAQPMVQRVANTASFIDINLPSGGIAQGSMFAVIGSGLGPAALEQVSEFPLPTDLGGTSVSITVGNTTLPAYMVFTLERQIAAILPSETPLGTGTVTVTYNGATSNPAPIRVVAHAFGMFAINQGGSGPGIVATPAGAVNTLTFSAKPGDAWVIWGTGLGAVAGDEAGGPLPGDLADLDVEVWVGGMKSEIIYRGRSGCCSGIDQIAFYVPAGASGCYVPLVVVVEGVPSNSVTMSIEEGGGTCSDINGLSSTEISAVQGGSDYRAGQVTLNRTGFPLSLPAPLPSPITTTDTASGIFGSYSFGQLIGAQTVAPQSTPATCTVYQFQGVHPVRGEPVAPAGLDAGDISVQGPSGDPITLDAPDVGRYSGELSGTQLPLPGLPGNFPAPYLEPGDYTVTGAGGMDVGAFTGTITVPSGASWTNKDLSDHIARGSDYTVQWSGASGTVVVAGASILVSQNVGAAFRCEVPADDGSFTIPARILSALPLPETQEGLPTALLGVGVKAEPVVATADGLDRLEIRYESLDTRTVTYE